MVDSADARSSEVREVTTKAVRVLRWGLLFAATLARGNSPLLSAQSQSPSLEPARRFIAEGNLPAAKTALESILQADPHATEAHFLLAFVHFRQHDAKHSLAEYTLGAAGRRPTGSEFRVIGADYVLLNDFADADRWFTQATQEDPNDAAAWYLLGRAKYNEGKYGDAQSCFERVLTIHPLDLRTEVKAEDNIGLSLQGLNQLPEATAAFEKAIALQHDAPAQSGAPYLDLGELLLQQSQPEKAVQPLRVAAKLSPGNPKAHEQLGVALRQIDDLAGARVELEKAAALAPDASPVHFELGQVYRRLGLKDQATRELEICSRLTAAHSSAEVPNVEGAADSGDQPHPPSTAPSNSHSN